MVDEKNVLLALVYVSVFFFAGAIFGWAPMMVILEKEGTYGELCTAGEALPCADQVNAMTLVYTLGSTALPLFSMLFGHHLDLKGPARSIVLAAAAIIPGLLLFGVSGTKDGEVDLFIPGAVLMGAGGMLAFFCSFPASFMFQHVEGMQVPTPLSLLL